MQPVRSIAPNVGLNPNIPQYVAGRTIEPTVCVPKARGAMPAATAAADPLDEPPGVCAAWCGLRVGPARAIAYSVDAVVPTMTAPASRSRLTTSASRAGTRDACTGVPSVHLRPATSIVSLMAIGRP